MSNSIICDEKDYILKQSKLPEIERFKPLKCMAGVLRPRDHTRYVMVVVEEFDTYTVSILNGYWVDKIVFPKTDLSFYCSERGKETSPRTIKAAREMVERYLGKWKENNQDEDEIGYCFGEKKRSMITKEHEEKAWEELKTLFPNHYITLNAEYKRYDNGEEHKKYQAYVSLAKPCLSYESDTPAKAVDDLKKKVEERNKR